MAAGFPMFFTVEARSLRPTQRALWKGYAVEVQRQARRTTFLRIVDPELEGAVVQVKRHAPVLIELREDGL